MLLRFVLLFCSSFSEQVELLKCQLATPLTGLERCVAVCCRMLQCVAVCGRVLQCVAIYGSVWQCVAVYCSVMQCVAVWGSLLQCVAVCCSVWQCVAVCLKCVAACYRWHLPALQCPVGSHCNTLPHTAPHGNTLQHTVTNCNTLQHTATHCVLPALQDPVGFRQRPYHRRRRRRRGTDCRQLDRRQVCLR